MRWERLYGHVAVNWALPIHRKYGIARSGTTDP
jgi:hypothetical protein